MKVIEHASSDEQTAIGCINSSHAAANPKNPHKP